jgi:hypothetical protein
MRAKRRGEVTPPATCQITECEATNLVAHHSDYSRPLDVLFTCRRHHALLHSGVELRVKPGVPSRLKRLPSARNSAPAIKRRPHRMKDTDATQEGRTAA